MYYIVSIKFVNTFFDYYYNNVRGGISHNVLGIRRFGQAIGQCGALTPAQTVGEGWRGSERSDRPSQPEPRGALAPMRIPIVKRWFCNSILYSYLLYF